MQFLSKKLIVLLIINLKDLSVIWIKWIHICIKWSYKSIDRTYISIEEKEWLLYRARNEDIKFSLGSCRTILSHYSLWLNWIDMTEQINELNGYFNQIHWIIYWNDSNFNNSNRIMEEIIYTDKKKKRQWLDRRQSINE